MTPDTMFDASILSLASRDQLSGFDDEVLTTEVYLTFCVVSVSVPVEVAAIETGLKLTPFT